MQRNVVNHLLVVGVLRPDKWIVIGNARSTTRKLACKVFDRIIRLMLTVGACNAYWPLNMHKFTNRLARNL